MAAPHTSSPLDAAALGQAKVAMRAEAIAARAAQNPTAAGEALTRVVLRDSLPPPGAVVSGFWPLEGEIDIRPLLLALHDLGNPIVLPATPGRGHPLTFRLWAPGDIMLLERFGTLRPTREERTPSFLFVPLLAFDRRGGRLGYGAGYYDRTLIQISPRTTVGCAFAAQEVPEVPMGPDDVRLDAVATDREIIRCSLP